MYPVDAAVTELLYEGFSREGRGRGNYLPSHGRHRAMSGAVTTCDDKTSTHLLAPHSSLASSE